MSRLQEVLEQIHETCYIRQALMYYHPNHYKKLKASSFKHGGKRKRPTVIDQIHGEWARDNGYKASSSKPQASSPKHKASSSEGSSEDLRSSKPQATSSMIREPRNI